MLNCSLNEESTNFCLVVYFSVLSIINNGPTLKNQCGRHFQDGRHIFYRFITLFKRITFFDPMSSYFTQLIGCGCFNGSKEQLKDVSNLLNSPSEKKWKLKLKPIAIYLTLQQLLLHASVCPFLLSTKKMFLFLHQVHATSLTQIATLLLTLPCRALNSCITDGKWVY